MAVFTSGAVALVFLVFYVDANRCHPCFCRDAVTVDCTNLDVISEDEKNIMEMFRFVMLPTSLIDHRTPRLNMKLIPSHPADCKVICAVKGLDSTCICKVGVFLL